MGLTYAFLVASTHGTVDLTRPALPEASDAVMRRLFPRTPHVRTGTERLLTTCFPPRPRPAVGVFDGGVVIATRDAHLFDPSILHARYRKPTDFPDLQLLTSESVNDMFAYGHWVDGALRRTVSVNATAGLWRDVGEPGDEFSGIPVDPDHWLDLSNHLLGRTLRLIGDAAPAIDDPGDWDAVALHTYARADAHADR